MDTATVSRIIHDWSRKEVQSSYFGMGIIAVLVACTLGIANLEYPDYTFGNTGEMVLLTSVFLFGLLFVRWKVPRDLVRFNRALERAPLTVTGTVDWAKTDGGFVLELIFKGGDAYRRFGVKSANVVEGRKLPMVSADVLVWFEQPGETGALVACIDDLVLLGVGELRPPKPSEIKIV